MKLGLYTHFKKGDSYIAYDVLKDEATGENVVSYVSLLTQKKFSRKVSVFMEDVSSSSENETGQKQRFEFVTNKVNFFTLDVELDEKDLEKRPMIISAPKVRTYDEFRDKYMIPFTIQPGDTLIVSPLPIRSKIDVEGMASHRPYHYTIMEVGKYFVRFLQEQDDEQVLLKELHWSSLHIVGIIKKF